MTTITEAFELPRPEDIRAMGFVVKLRELDPNSAEVEQLARDYVVTPAVEKELPRILDDMKQVFDRGEEYGRFIHGSFGSGKSHFMTMLSLLVEGAPPAWKKFRPVLNAHRDAQKAKTATTGGEAPDHEAWLTKAGLLVVRIHMLSVRGKSTGFDRAVYEGFNAALKRRGKAPFEFLNVDAIFDEVRREATEYGDIVWKRLETASIVGGREDFEAIAAGSSQGKERFVRSWLVYKGRSPADAGIDPRWSEGLMRMAEHAKAQGFGGIVLMIDEFLLWLAEKSGQEFVKEVHDLSLVVDHDGGQRRTPIFVFVARQRNLQEFYPDLVDESKIHEHIDHQLKRFETTKLQDVELRHIVRGRVLRPRNVDAVKAAVSSLSEKHSKVLPALLAGGDLDYLKDVYPFHPALIEMLVDVTSLMQRERSALRLLYELLVVHYPTLPLGEFLPVGSAFSAIFPESGVEASKKVELMQDIHHQYYSRLAPAMARMAEDGGAEFNEERRRALDQLVKTVLLAEVSPRLKQAGLTIERLVQLNAVDVEGETFRGQVRVAETDLLTLSQRVPDLQVSGGGKTAIVRFVLGRVSLGEILARARSKVDNVAERFKVFWPALRAALGIAGGRGFEDGGANEGDWELSWRRTKRRGQIKLGNVREMSYEDFAPDGSFKILVDYPWDDPGHTVDEDRLKATKVRRKHGLLYTVCWLPRHMTPTELNVLTELAAVRYLISEAGQEDLLETLAPQDRSKVLEQAGIRLNTLSGQLEELLKEVYIRHGEFFALLSDLDPRRPRETLAENLEHIAALLLDRRYPQHPTFHAEPKKQDLELLLTWMVAAGETATSVPYDENVGRVLKTLGQPLELTNLGQTKAGLRLDSRYIKDVLQRVDEDSVAWTPIADHLRETYGLQPLVIDLFLAFLCKRDHRALNEINGEPVAVGIGMPSSTRIRLQRGELVSAAEWSRLRELGHQLFDIPAPTPTRSLQAQDSFTGDLRTKGQEKRTVLQGLHSHLVKLGVDQGDRLSEIATANARLAPLAESTTDTRKVLAALLTQWPADTSDALRSVVQEAEAIRDAVAELSEHARTHLKAGVNHPIVGAEVRTHLAALDGRLASAQAEQPLTKAWITTWNATAQALIRRLIEQPQVPQVPQVPQAPQTSGGGGERQSPAAPAAASVPDGDSIAPRRTVLLERRVDPTDADAVSDFLAEVRKALSELGTRPTGVALVRTEDVE